MRDSLSATHTDLSAFAAEVDAFIAEHFRPPALAAWRRALCERGWSTVRWPVAEGGAGFSPEALLVWERTLARRGAWVGDRITLDAVGPLLCALPSSPQRDSWLRAIRRLQERWVVLDLRPRLDVVQRGHEAGGGLLLSAELHGVPGLPAARWALAIVPALPPDAANPEQGSDLSPALLVVIDLRAPGVHREFSPELGAEAAAAAGTELGLDSPFPLIGSLILERYPIAPTEVLLRGAAVAAALGPVEPALTQLNPDLVGSAALRRLQEAVVEAFNLDADEERRSAELGVELLAQDALERRLLALDRSDPGFWPLELMRRQRGIELRLRLEDFAVQCLGYYALPYGPDHPGQNEPAIGPIAAREQVARALRARGLDLLDEGALQRRDQLAERLEL